MLSPPPSYRVAAELFQATGRLEAPSPGRHVGTARDEDVPRFDGGTLATVLLAQIVRRGDKHQRVDAFLVALKEAVLSTET